MIRLQRDGYRSGHLATDLSLGLVSGLSLSLWSYVYAAIVFVGALSVYLPVGILVMLIGWVAVSVWVVLTSREPLHIATTDDQAVVIFGSIAALMVAGMGDLAATPRGLATILFVMASTTLMFAACCYAVGRFRLSRVLELLPFPVVCGFMASVGWLLLAAGFEVAADVALGPSLIGDLAAGSRLLRLGLSATLGATLLWVTARVDKSWTLPAASLAIVVAYHLVVGWQGIPRAEQVADGWLFDIPESAGGVLAMLSSLSPGAIDWRFVASAVPLMATVILISMLYASMTVTGLKAESSERLDIGEEFRILGAGNVFCAAVCCPPGYTDVVATTMYRKLGATSRWFVLSSSAVGLAVALFGGSIIAYLPKLLIGANIFLFAFAMLYDWLYRNVRGFGLSEYMIVVIILGMTMFVGFLEGVGTGIVLTVLLFVFRYSQISAVQSRSTLRDLRSSVERSHADKAALRREGDRVIVYHLRGFLFFGTANAILDTVAERDCLAEGRCAAVLMDLQRVTGIDVSALNTFTQIKALCDAAGVALVYSGAIPETGARLRAMGAVTVEQGQPLIFDDEDFALEFLENRLLRGADADPGQGTIQDFLTGVIREPHKVGLLLQALDRTPLAAGQTLFAQGDPDSGLYIVEEGYLSAFISTPDGQRIRVKKFSPGSLVGELSAYLRDMHRTATVVADTDSVVYHLDVEKLKRLEGSNHELKACIHELVATTLADRVSYMNRRLLAERG
jgi:SulP family sulfate permease